jgi:hypothetical protein
VVDRWILVQGSDEGETSSGWSRDRANGLNGCKIVDTDTEMYERRQSIKLLMSKPIDTDPSGDQSEIRNVSTQHIRITPERLRDRDRDRDRDRRQPILYLGKLFLAFSID